MKERKNRVRKLTLNDREIICMCYMNGVSGKQLAEMFQVSPARISQIVNNYYMEMPE